MRATQAPHVSEIKGAGENQRDSYTSREKQQFATNSQLPLPQLKLESKYTDAHAAMQRRFMAKGAETQSRSQSDSVFASLRLGAIYRMNWRPRLILATLHLLHGYGDDRFVSRGPVVRHPIARLRITI